MLCCNASGKCINRQQSVVIFIGGWRNLSVDMKFFVEKVSAAAENRISCLTLTMWTFTLVTLVVVTVGQRLSREQRTSKSVLILISIGL